MSIFDKKVVDFRTRDQKVHDAKVALVNGWNNFAGFVRDNKDVIVIVAPAAAVAIGSAGKVISKAIDAYAVNKEIKDINTRIYDHSLGKYARLKRPLTAKESLTIEERRAAGEKLHTILNDMGLLK